VSAWLIAVVTLIYIGVAIDQGYEGNTGWALCYAGYAIANVGVMLAMARL